MSKSDIYIKRCLDLARIYCGYVRINPSVGAVIVNKDKVIGEGAHQQYGLAHAEVNAVKSVNDREKLPESSLFVSLEPCFHQGKTPPCVQLILEKKIPHVEFSCEDPNPLVAGKSSQLLEENGVDVKQGTLHRAGAELIRPFVRGMISKRPYIILKYAQTSNLKIGMQAEQVWLTNIFSKYLVHKWRAEADAIMVGTNTAVWDNPSLNNRLYFGKKQLLRIVVDRTLKVPPTHGLLDGVENTIVLTAEKVENATGIEYFQSNFEGDYLQHFFEQLYIREIGVLIVEGGSALLQSLIDQGLWDEARVFTVSKKLGNEAVAAPILTNEKLIRKVSLKTDIIRQYFNIMPS
ncbi:MAG: bifunctional diaminohydroxyphosphoribosylaminopyrimidine deaminase/5-amino-6-(5-phosphoribosylamino)uracil reductase RibD [Saprospiraceae bacterium]